MTTDEFLDNMQSSFPHIYNVYDHNTILYALLSVYASKFGAKEDIINRVYAMIGIDSTYDEDLEHRWGSLLGIYKNNGESFGDYRARLMIIYASLTGGTEEAIKYAVASAIGISSNQDMINEYIHIYDAWTYYGFDTHKYGAFVCTIDLTVDENIVAYYDKIIRAINQTKASGIAAYLMLLYITNELCTIHMNEYDKMNVSESSSDAGRIVVDDNKLTDKASQTIQEKGTCTAVATKIWYPLIGMHTDVVLNNDFRTNMLLETDMCKDVIRQI